MTLSEKLKEARGNLGLSQKEMARAVGSGYRSWQGYEQGSSVPGGKVFEALAGLGFNVHWFFADGVPMRLDEVTAQGDLDSFLHYIDKRLAELEKEDQDVRPWFRYEFKKRFPELIEREAAETETDNRQQEQKLA